MRYIFFSQESYEVVVGLFIIEIAQRNIIIDLESTFHVSFRCFRQKWPHCSILVTGYLTQSLDSRDFSMPIMFEILTIEKFRVSLLLCGIVAL